MTDAAIAERARVVVLGAGFGGLCVAHRLAQAGIDDVVILERADGVGGTWRANTYPGAECDVPSHLYSLSWAPNPRWSKAFAGQAEILAYIEDCYDRFDVRRKVRTGVEVVEVSWLDERDTWSLRSATGATYEAQVVVSAVGMFNTPKLPDLDGLDDFEGPSFHSARWDHDVDLDGRRVAVIGTGASAIQVVPAIADRTARVDVYQRTAPWILPRKDDPYPADQQATFAEQPEVAREHRRALHDMLETTTAFVAGDPSVDAIATMARDYLAHKVPDPDLRAQLTPTQPFGCQRTLISSDWYPTVQRDDVELVTTPIETITPSGVRTVDGTDRDVDVIVWCTGFEAARYLSGLRVTGRRGADLHERWGETPRAYQGICVPDFPNLFLLYGPNTNQGGNSILLVLEAQAEFVASAAGHLDERRAASIEVTAEAAERYDRQLRRDLSRTVWAQGCSSYFFNEAGEIVTQLPYTAGAYAAATAQIDPADFTFAGTAPGGDSCTTS